MPVIDHIDGPNRDIYLHSDTVGVDVHPMDIYREMRALRRTDETLRQFDVFLTAQGNLPKGGGKFTERYVICMGGTRIIPFDISHEITVIGVIITDDGQEGIACFDRSSLTATTIVDINYVPPQVEVVRAEAELAAIRSAGFGQVVALDPVGGVPGTGNTLDGSAIGTHKTPSNNVPDTLTIASNEGIETIVIHGAVTITTGHNVSELHLKGENAITTYLTLEAGAVAVDTKFSEMFIINSVFDGKSYVYKSYLENVSNIEGYIENSILSQNIQISNNQPTYIIDCKSACFGVGTEVPVIDMSAGNLHLAFRNWSGPIRIINSTDPNNTVCFDSVSAATVDIDASCTEGTMILRGVITHTNNSTMTVNSSTQLDPRELDEIWQLQGLDADNPMTVTPTTRNVGSISQAISGNGVTTSTVTRNP